MESRDLDKDRLSEVELDELIGKRDHREFLNTRNELYRKRRMKENPPSRAEAIKLMAKEPNLIRRPMIVKGSQIFLGFDEEAYRKL
jgi:arsenate reductase-like glutaredoxin family protein